jgi:hypothetical protein
MRKSVNIALLAIIVCTSAQISLAGGVEKACLKSGRSAANARLCICIDAVARSTLGFSQQNTAARLILSPNKAQRIKTSIRKSEKEFWAAYKNFAKAAERRCK